MGVKVEGEILYQIWVTCPNLDCGNHFDVVDTDDWRKNAEENAEEALDIDPDPEIENCYVEISCPECKCDLELVRTHY